VNPPRPTKSCSKKTKLQDQTKRTKANPKNTCPSPKLQTFIDSDQVQPNPTTCINQKTTPNKNKIMGRCRSIKITLQVKTQTGAPNKDSRKGYLLLAGSKLKKDGFWRC